MKNLLLSLMLVTASAAACAQVDVSGAWIRATVPSAKSSGLFMQIKSTREAQLVEVRSPVAGTVEIHQMQMDGQTMRMHAVPFVALPAGQTVNMVSGGYHVMLMDLKRQLKEGETVPVTLLIRKQSKGTETMSLDVTVKPLTYSGH